LFRILHAYGRNFDVRLRVVLLLIQHR